MSAPDPTPDPGATPATNLVETGGDDAEGAVRAWPEMAREMVEELAARRRLTDPVWREILAGTPRHEFVPHTPQQQAYSTAVVTQTRSVQSRRDADGMPCALATSSLSTPAAVAVALDALAVTGRERVLEIGTGTGYVAALLSRRLGDRQVCSIDLDPELVSTAADRLAGLGLRPTLRAGDGYEGLAGHAPYDRILATCAISHVPPAWIHQLAPGGRIVAPLAGGLDSPVVVLDKTAEDEVSGRFLLDGGGFMPLRAALGSPLAPGEQDGGDPEPIGHHGTTALDPARIIDRGRALALFCRLHLPGLTQLVPATGDPDHPADRGTADPAGRLVLRHGTATAVVERRPGTEGRWTLTQTGPRRIWDTLESALALWEVLEHPDPARFGITALDQPHRQYVWLDEPDGPYAWPLDPAPARRT